MDCFYIVIFIAVLFLIGWIRAWFEGSRESKGRFELEYALSKGLTVENERETVTLDSGDAVDVYRIIISGTIVVPAPETKCDLIVEVADITHDMGDKDDWPVLCLISDLANSAGLFESHEELTIPYAISTVKEMQILAVPVSALVFPKKGQRRARIRVSLTSTDGLAHVYCQGKTVILHQQDVYGYKEIAKRDIEADKAIVALALCLSAVDGHMVSAEADVIQSYCTNAFENLDKCEAAKRRDAVNKTIRVFMQKRKSTGHIGTFWGRACDRIIEQYGARVSQVAYELCVRMVAADKNADDAEMSMLAETARRLDIPDELDRELRDRYFSVVMFREENHDDLLGMPNGLSREEKIEFLNREYQKWRQRVTHGDSEVATEAAFRVKKIAEARKRLEEE